VFTAQAIGGLAMAAGLSGQSRLPSGTIEVMRKNVFIDTPSEARGPSASVPIASPARNKPRRDVGGPSPRVVQILRPWGKFPLRSGEIAGASSGHGYSVERQGRQPQIAYLNTAGQWVPRRRYLVAKRSGKNAWRRLTGSRWRRLRTSRIGYPQARRSRPRRADIKWPSYNERHAAVADVTELGDPEAAARSRGALAGRSLRRTISIWPRRS